MSNQILKEYLKTFSHETRSFRMVFRLMKVELSAVGLSHAFFSKMVIPKWHEIWCKS